MSKLITNTIRHTGGSADNITLTSGGHVLIGDGGNDNAFFKAHAADGEASDQYVAQFINAEATAGVNYGVNIQGGSNSTDHGLRVKNHAGTAQLLVRGDGKVGIGTGSPDTLLHLSGADTAVIRLENTDASLGQDQLVGGIEWESNDGSGAGAGVFGGIRLRSDDSYGARSYMAFSTRENSTGAAATDTEQFRILAEGGVTFNGDTAAANALDDYEEGTFTPGVSFGGGGAGQSYTTQTGSYTKIGNTVHFNLYCEFSAAGNSTGTAKVTSLPFTVSNSACRYSALSLFIKNINYGYTDATFAWADPNATTITLKRGNSVNLDDGDFNDDTELMIAGHYKV